MAAEGFGKVGILASSTSINAGLYQRELSKHRIGALVPTKDEQKMISDLIFKILTGANFSADLTRVIQVIENLENHGAEAFILGCTDLRLINLPSNVPMIDSTSVLEDVATRYLVDLN
jgi:aspartate racemase